MGRRRSRADEDGDDTLELQYSRKQRGVAAVSSHQEAKEGVNKGPKKKKFKGNLEESVNLEENQSKKKDDDEAEKIAKLGLTKLRRKEGKKKAKQEQRQKDDARETTQKKKLEERTKKQAAFKAKKEKAKTTPENSYTRTKMGVQYQDILVGKGPAVLDRKKVRVSYVLRVGNKRGKILDSSEDFGFRLGRGEVIKGWDIGVQGMRQGGIRYLIVPPDAGYGQDNIGGGSGATLFFEVTVVGGAE
jgi:FK506-binding nuclear protein